VQPDSTVKSVTVTILATEAGSSAITGVTPGDQLVTDGFDKLQNGSKIVQRKVPAEGKAPAEANATAKKPG
jgi:hypothetical protein